MDTIGDRLRLARESAHERMGRTHKITQSELGLNMELTQGAIYKMETNQRKRGEIDVIKLMNAAEFLRCSFLWLATGQGSMQSNDQNVMDALERSNGCPLVPPENLEATPVATLEIPDSLVSRISPDSFYTMISDEGMSPAAWTGDIVLVDTGASVCVGDWVLARVADKSMAVVRRIIERSSDKGHAYTLQTLNPEFADRPLKKISDILGIVREVRSYPRRTDSYARHVESATSHNVVRLPV